MDAEHRVADLKTRTARRRRVAFVPEQRASHTGTQMEWAELEPTKLVERAAIVESQPELGIQARGGIAAAVAPDMATEVRQRSPGDLMVNAAEHVPAVHGGR